MQRFFDLLFASLALVILAPLLVSIMLILRFTGEREVFFVQQRLGRAKKPFGLCKFATMLKDSPKIGCGEITLKNDPRVLPFGRFLRKTKINELPQLINVLKGDMSLIGPRPQSERCFHAFPVASQEEICKVRPGLSGIGSVVFRGEENMMEAVNDPNAFYDDVIMPYKGLLEEWYVHNRDMRIYFLLIFLTVCAVAVPSNRFVWRAFPELPNPPVELQVYVPLV